MSLKSLAAVLTLLILGGCAAHPPLLTVVHVDIRRFMGDWYVIANIPTFIETKAYNAVESYRLDDDGTIATTFTFREGGFDGEPKRYTPRGFIVDPVSNAVWGMQFVWPIKADYRIMALADDYAYTVVGRQKRDYVWIMARKPVLDETEYQRLLTMLAEQGYAVNLIRKVPQQWR